MMAATGTMMTRPAIRRSRQRVTVKPLALITFATHSAVANLANSAGCMLNEPTFIHESEPLMSCARNGVAKSTTTNSR